MDNINQSKLQAENNTEKNARILSSHAPILLKNAANALKERLQQDPKNGKLWFQLGNIQRGLGELQLAKKAFSHAEKLNHEPTLSRYLMALCDQTSIKLVYPDCPFIPVPFIRCFSLLTKEEIDTAWQILTEHTQSFKASSVGKNQTIKNTRDSIVLNSNKFKTLRDLFKTRIKPNLTQAFEIFGIEPPEKQRYDIQMTSHSNGEFYRTHTDAGPRNARTLSYVYYFNKSPKAFSGGELQLFDTNTNLDIAKTTMTSIDPLHNSLIIFPSNYYHQVCTVNLSNNDRLWGRQTINGWLVDAERQNKIDSKEKINDEL